MYALNSKYINGMMSLHV